MYAVSASSRHEHSVNAYTPSIFMDVVDVSRVLTTLNPIQRGLYHNVLVPESELRANRDMWRSSSNPGLDVRVNEPVTTVNRPSWSLESESKFQDLKMTREYSEDTLDAHKFLIEDPVPGKW